MDCWNGRNQSQKLFWFIAFLLDGFIVYMDTVWYAFYVLNEIFFPYNLKCGFEV